MKSRSRTNKASLQSMATGTVLMPLFAISLATSGFVLSTNANAQKTTIITFDVPSAGTGSGQGTQSQTVNSQGTITGFYIDSGGTFHGFVRTLDGTITTFDPSGSVYTIPLSITPAGVIAGYYVDDVNFVPHGFVRALNGTFTSFDAPGSIGFGTFALTINSAGEVGGNYNDSNFLSHGFLRAPDGTITSFDAPGASPASFGTFSSASDALNPAGALTGAYWDANNVQHSYVRFPSGTFATFVVGGASTNSGQGTNTTGINSAGAVSGSYNDATGVLHGYVRAPNGIITKFDPPGVGTGGTWPFSINSAGTIAGYYFDASNVSHGFVRTADGTFTIIDVPGAGTGSGQGTILYVVSNSGALGGYYNDANNVSHGVLVEGE
jgi:hypothetical protein